MRKNFKLLGAVAVAGVVATTGSAFTAGNTLNGENVAGFGTDTITGANTSVIEHSLSPNGATITSTSLTFSTDLAPGTQVKAGFGTTALQSCTVTFGDGTATTPVFDTAVCLYTTGYDNATATDFRVAVS